MQYKRTAIGWVRWLSIASHCLGFAENRLRLGKTIKRAFVRSVLALRCPCFWNGRNILLEEKTKYYAKRLEGRQRIDV